jgi:transcriptional regulator NrdR family protein
MKCPVCGVWVSIKETRQQADNTTKRRYECGNQHRFTTQEKIIKLIKPKNAKQTDGK